MKVSKPYVCFKLDEQHHKLKAKEKLICGSVKYKTSIKGRVLVGFCQPDTNLDFSGKRKS